MTAKRDTGPGSDGRPADLLRLASFLPYRLSVLAEVVSRGLARRYAGRFGLSIPEWRVLAALGEHRDMTARDIGRMTRMHKTKVSRAVALLAAKGLVMRRASAGDRRETSLVLSERGRGVYQAVVPEARAYEAEVFTGLGHGERAAFEAALAKLEARAERLLAPDPP